MAEGTKRPAEIVLGAETRKLRRDLAAAKGEIRGFGKDAASTIRSSVGTAFAGAFSLASLGGAVSVVKEVVANERALTRLGIQADVSDERVRGLAGGLAAVSTSTGQSVKDLVAGASEIVTLTGDFDLAVGSARSLGVAATATGAEMKDLAGVAAALGQNMDIDPSRLGDALDILAVGGKKGSVELKDLATLLPTASAGFKGFGEKGTQAVAVLGAALQVTKTSTGTASEAATAFNALGKSLEANAKRIKKFAGVDVNDKDGKRRDFTAIIEDLKNAKLKKGATLFDVLGTEEAVKSFRAISDNWDDFQSLISAGLAGGGTLEADFKRYLESPAGRIELAWTRASNALQAAVTPERVELIADATEQFARALGFVVDHGRELVTIIGAAKLAQFSLATNRWAESFSGVSLQAGAVQGKMAGASAQLRTMNNGVGQLGSSFARVASHATGILGALTASYQMTSLVVDALGLFEDKTKTTATADDPKELASKQEQFLEQINEKREPLLARKRNIENMLALPGERFGDAKLREDLESTNARLQALEPEFQRVKAEFIAATVFERDQARGTESSDNVLGELKDKSLLEKTGATGVIDVDTKLLQTFGAEAASLQGAQLDSVIDALERMIVEQQKTRELQQKVADKPSFDSPAPGPLMVSAPRTGTTPR